MGLANRAKMKIVKCKVCGLEKQHKAWGICRKCYDKRHSKKYYQSNIERLLAKQKDHYWLNREEVLARNKEYHQNGKVHSVRIGIDRNKQYWAYNTGKLVHIAIAEKALGRRFKTGECCHHVDGNGLNNLHSNLFICSSSYHRGLHNKMRAWRGNANK